MSVPMSFVMPQPMPTVTFMPAQCQAGGIQKEQWTTLTLRNLPNNYTRAMFLSMLDNEGFAGAYDFVYLPIDFNSKACLGYAFVNLANPAHVQAFWQTFDGYAKWVLPSRKVCSVNWSSPHQGLEQHIERYKNSPLMHASMPDEYKPMLFKDGVRISFPAPTKAIRAPRVRNSANWGPSSRFGMPTRSRGRVGMAPCSPMSCNEEFQGTF